MRVDIKGLIKGYVFVASWACALVGIAILAGCLLAGCSHDPNGCSAFMATC